MTHICVMTDDAHFRLRIPRHLKEWVDASAKRNNRSINAEIISCLEIVKLEGNESKLTYPMSARLAEYDKEMKVRRAKIAEEMKELNDLMEQLKQKQHEALSFSQDLKSRLKNEQ